MSAQNVNTIHVGSSSIVGAPPEVTLASSSSEKNSNPSRNRSCVGALDNLFLRIQERVKKIVCPAEQFLSLYIQNVTSEDVSAKEDIQITLNRQILELKIKNQELEQTFANIKHFLETDEELLAKFRQCILETGQLLLPPTSMDRSPSVNNPLAEEWRLEAQKASYLESLKTRFRDFLQKNPEFFDLIKKKFQAKSTSNVLLLEGIIGSFTSLAPNAHDEVVTLSFEPEPQTPLAIITPDVKSALFRSRPLTHQNQKALLIFARIQRFIKTDTELTALFQRWLDPSLIQLGMLLENSYKNNSSSLVLFSDQEILSTRLALMKALFLDFLDQHPTIKEAFLRKLNEKTAEDIQ